MPYFLSESSINMMPCTPCISNRRSHKHLYTAQQEARNTQDKQITEKQKKLMHTYYKLESLPIPICMIVNLKNGQGGWTIHATIRPIIEPDIVVRMTLKGINHLKINKILVKS